MAVTRRQKEQQQKQQPSNNDQSTSTQPQQSEQQKAAKEDSPKPERIALGDQYNMQRLMEAAATKEIEGQGYESHENLHYVRMACLAAAAVIQIYTYFQKGGFPGNWWLYFGSVTSYVLLVGLATAIYVLYERGAFMLTRPKKDSPYPRDLGMGLLVRSTFPRNSEKFKLSIRRRRHVELLWPQREMEIDVGEYFHSDGYLAETKFRNRVAELIKEFERGPGKSQ